VFPPSGYLLQQSAYTEVLAKETHNHSAMSQPEALCTTRN